MRRTSIAAPTLAIVAGIIASAAVFVAVASRVATVPQRGDVTVASRVATVAPGVLPTVAPGVATAAPGVATVPALGADKGSVGEELVATFSIVAFDAETGDLGVAVQSKFFAVGRVVPFAAAGVGAIATQSYANTTFGRRGLEMLRGGAGAHAVVDLLLADDPQRALRQVAVIDATGLATSFTGESCLPWAGARQGEGYSVQGNLLTGPEVVAAMAAAFEQSGGDVASRMVTALAAGQAAGGDARGRQSAALLVVREGAGYGGFDDRYIDLRVDDHATPIAELQRLLDIHHGTEATEHARRLLREAARGNESDALLGLAAEQALSATLLNDGDGWSWMTLAEARLALGDLDGAAEAGVKALGVDPWIKAAVLGGVAGSVDAIEMLLRDEVFRRAWEAIPAR